MFVFAATLVPRRRDIRHGNVGERENLNPGNHQLCQPAPADPVRPRTATAAAERHVEPPGRHQPINALTYIKRDGRVEGRGSALGGHGRP
eukprot:scaffold4411_cov45-Phaeocystis_antarctica.AAC.1